MRLVRRGEGRATRWKNGGGVTHELAVWPDGADLSRFDARLSMAEVAADGPFSAFAGIDRTLAVLEGGPMRLSFGGAEVVLAADGPRVHVDSNSHVADAQRRTFEFLWDKGKKPEFSEVDAQY